MHAGSEGPVLLSNFQFSGESDAFDADWRTCAAAEVVSRAGHRSSCELPVKRICVGRLVIQHRDATLIIKMSFGVKDTENGNLLSMK